MIGGDNKKNIVIVKKECALAYLVSCQYLCLGPTSASISKSSISVARYFTEVFNINSRLDFVGLNTVRIFYSG